ncbi:pirin family protein [Aquabacterium soli]|uniref:Pirin family protein n=1 Tax=Aquabacterium soli TaxID=2493092 RepID=A0A426V705_9BURK|nr:pirin family protein [Aquabacterium soli]RRS02697.1 pirin family protein [Aquabacterium soli]
MTTADTTALPLTRPVATALRGQPAEDGAGVRLTRVFQARSTLNLDPFLMLDEFASDQADDYIAGFPSHPHRGFETVTYMLEGHMLHEDHLGNQGHLRDGDVQWMTAGRGIIHSEMPQQQEGRMRGFQLWINLPAAEKMKPAAYRDIPADQIPRAVLADGGWVKVIAGETANAQGQPVRGPIQGLSTEPLYLHAHLPAGAAWRTAVPPGHTALVYVADGDIEIDGRALHHGWAGVLGHGAEVALAAGPQGADVLLLAGKPLREPVVQYGPFVMNTREEIEQALRDYNQGTLAGPEK